MFKEYSIPVAIALIYAILIMIGSSAAVIYKSSVYKPYKVQQEKLFGCSIVNDQGICTR